MPRTYTDAAGRHYRPLAVVPYSELTPGSPFAMPGKPDVCFRGAKTAKDYPHLNREVPGLAQAMQNCMVVMLERIA